MTRTANTATVERPSAAPQAQPETEATEVTPIQAIVNEALASCNMADLAVFDVKAFQVKHGLKPLTLHGTVELTDGHLGHFHTEDVFIIVGKRFFDNGEFDYSYSLVAPTLEQTDGSFDPAKNISLSRNLRWLGTGAVSQNGNGSNAPRRIALQPTTIQLNDPVLLMDAHGKPIVEDGNYLPHPCLRPGGSRNAFQGGKRVTIERYRWDNTYQSNIRRFMPICAGLLLENGQVSAETRAKLQPNAGGVGEAPAGHMNFRNSGRQYRASNVDDVAPGRTPSIAFAPPAEDEIDA